jgi:hypothetical protein
MPTFDSVDFWIQDNLLDTSTWDAFEKKETAFIQANRNLTRWYPESELSDELLAYQCVWEVQGLDPVLKYQKQGIKAISEGSDRIDYSSRDKVAPEVREILGPPSYETAETETVILESGRLL